MQKGFTLIELSIVLVIIGLLVGGILQGQHLIEQAKINKAVTEIRSIQTGWEIFYSKYNDYPGDIKNPTRFFPVCGGSIEGDGNKTIDSLEWYCVWRQMYASGTYFATNVKKDEINPGLPGADTDFENNVSDIPFAKFNSIDNNYIYAYTTEGYGGDGNSISDKRGNALLAVARADSIDDDGGMLTVEEMSGIDDKLDDGLPGTGDVMAVQAGVPVVGADCFTNAVYDDSMPIKTSEYVLDAGSRKLCAFAVFLNTL